MGVVNTEHKRSNINFNPSFPQRSQEYIYLAARCSLKAVEWMNPVEKLLHQLTEREDGSKALLDIGSHYNFTTYLPTNIMRMNLSYHMLT